MNGAELHEMFSRPERSGRSLLSVYLDIDQSRPSNLNRGFETQLKNMIAAIRPSIHNEEELGKFNLAAHQISNFVSSYQPNARGLGLFFDESDGFFRDMEFDVPVQREARWDRVFYLQPLINALDEFQTYGVAMLDKRNLRLFTVFLGHIEEHVREGFGPDRVGHIKTAGSDHIASASRIQRRADEQVRLNLKHVVKMIDWLIESRHLTQLILAGKSDLTAELRNLLPKRLALRVIGDVDISIDTTVPDVLDTTRKIADAYQRHVEAQKVKDVVTTAAKTDKAVTGLGRTLKAVNSDRVWELIRSEGFAASGFECERCSALLLNGKESCQFCGGKVLRVRDVVERAVEQALRNGARVDVVRGEASISLDAVGGVAAFLRARTGTLRV
jgi:peptide subunit release factor 1 (eRF1)